MKHNFRARGSAAPPARSAGANPPWRRRKAGLTLGKVTRECNYVYTENMGVSANSLLRYLTPERGFDLIRIYLGVGLAVRGILFLMDPSWIGSMLDTGSSIWPRLIAFGHLGGGVLLALGLFTRVAAAVQVLPVLGAVILLHLREDLASNNQSLEFSALVLVMLIFFACFGAGEWSLDRQRLGQRSATRASQRA